MSKSAIKTINAAVSGKTAELLISIINNKSLRADWRNADRLAAALIDTVANAYQCENSGTFKANGFRDMDHAIHSYIIANLESWTDADYPHKPLALVLARLAKCVDAHNAANRNALMDFEHAYALDMNKVINTGNGAHIFYADMQQWLMAARETWLARRKPVRDAACAYKEAFNAFLKHADGDTFTQDCIAWLHAMDEAISINNHGYTPACCLEVGDHLLGRGIITAINYQDADYVTVSTATGSYEFHAEQEVHCIPGGGVTLYEVVENGPDSFDYVTHTCDTRLVAEAIAHSQERANAYLGYGYMVRPVSTGLTPQQHQVNTDRKAYAEHLRHWWHEYSAVVAAECEAYAQWYDLSLLSRMVKMGSIPNADAELTRLGKEYGMTDALRIIATANKAGK